MKKLFNILLMLGMVIGLMPGMTLTAHAAEIAESFITTGGGKHIWAPILISGAELVMRAAF